MRYVTHYEEYPIYEPAEGGYYYSGNQVVEHERLSKRKAKQLLEQLWNDCKQDNLENYGVKEPDFDRDKYGNRIYPWRRFGNLIIKHSKYIGEGESYVIERKLGKSTRGWRPYC